MRQQSGFTLLETLVFIIVVSVALTGIASLFFSNIQNSAAPLIRERTLTLAQAYMDEIISKRWDENTPVGGGCVDSDLTVTTDSCTQYCSNLNDIQCTRSKCALSSPGVCEASADISSILGPEEGAGNRSIWDDVDDYNNYTSSPPENIQGTSLTDYSGFTASVTVTQPSSSWNAIPANDVKRIQVSVTNTLGETLTLVSYKVNF